MSERALRQIEYVKRLFADQVLASERYVATGKTAAADKDYEFLKQFVVGRGLDICCGDFLIEGATGVDKWLTLGAFLGHAGTNGENLAQEEGSQDFVITNYPEVFENIPRAFREWHRVLKPGGRIGIVARNADHAQFSKDRGVLKNHHRNSAFNVNTLRMYLTRAGFLGVQVEIHDTALYAQGYKRHYVGD